MTKENIRKLKKLKLKQYQSPQLLTVEDKLSIEALEKLKYSRNIVAPSGSSATPSPTGGTSSDSGTSGGSARSNYSVLVAENRLWKDSYSSKKLSDYDDEMDKNLDHFRAAASFRAPFLLFIWLDLFSLSVD